MNKERSLKWYQNRVKILKSKPQPPQRTPEWYAARNTRITASESACCLNLSEEICKQYVDDFNIKNFKYKPNQCLSHYDTREDYIINKCRTFYGENLFKGLPSPFKATRYHSLIIEKETCPKNLKVTAQTKDEIIMGIADEKLKIFGVQFHPESIASEHGHQIIKNFLDRI